MAFNSYGCSFRAGAACHVPVMATDVPVPKLYILKALASLPQDRDVVIEHALQLVEDLARLVKEMP